MIRKNSVNNMKKVLIIAYAFPPYVMVGGLRPYNWYKYFREFGIDPVVVTRQWSNKNGNHLDYIAEGDSSNILIEESESGTLIKTPYTPNFANRLVLNYGNTRFRFIRRVITALYEFGQFILPMGPKYQILIEAERYLKNNKVDVIIATGEPFILFAYANKLSNKFGVPWIADYRDPWSNNETYIGNLILRKWHSFFEKRTVRSAAYVTTVSSFVQKKINSVVLNKSYAILPNGYDPMIVEEVQTIQQQDKFLQIAFAGTIYKWNPVESFLHAVSNFVATIDNPAFRINFYGTNIDNELITIITKYPLLKNHVFIFPKMQNNVLLQKLAENNVMLLFNYYSYLGTKIFDYLGIRRRIILCYSNDAEANHLKKKFYTIESETTESDQLQAELIEETKSGIIVSDSEHLFMVLSELYDEFIQTGHIECNSVDIEKYSRKIQVGHLANIVREIGARK